MIQVIIERDDHDRIEAFQMSGHADFAEHGKDLVCAGASAVAFGAVNAIFSLTEVEPHVEQGAEGGFLRIELPKEMSEADAVRTQTLLEGMVVSLQTIERDYESYIKITFNQ